MDHYGGAALNGEFWKRVSIGLAGLVLTLVGVVAGLAHQRINMLEDFKSNQEKVNLSYAVQIQTNKTRYEDILEGIRDLKRSMDKLESKVD